MLQPIFPAQRSKGFVICYLTINWSRIDPE